MSIKVFVLTEDLNFFYRINKELNRLKIKFKILDFWNKIPKFHSVILTTSKEIQKFKEVDEDITKILSYAEGDDFNRFIFKVLAAFKVGYIENYYELIFSIDPGTEHFGLVVFLDDYYLKSFTFNDKDSLLQQIRDLVSYFQSENTNLPAIRLKFGSGVISTSIDLINMIYNIFKDREKLSIFIVDEKKSSQINLYIKKTRFPKHEASALILALRNGTKIDKSNFLKLMKRPKAFFLINRGVSAEIENNRNYMLKIKEIGEKVLNGELTLSQSLKISEN